jgi:hypothetical protein
MAASVVACIIIIGAAITVALFYDRRGQQDAANKVAFVNAAGDLAAFVRRSFSVPSIMFAQMATALNEGSSAGFSLRNFRSQSLQLIRLNSGQWNAVLNPWLTSRSQYLVGNELQYFMRLHSLGCWMMTTGMFGKNSECTAKLAVGHYNGSSRMMAAAWAPGMVSLWN